MTKRLSTKRAFFASVMALILCFTMLLGTTYAWFTDTVTSTGNKIQAGTLKIDLEMLVKDDVNNTTTWTSIKTSKAPIFDYTKWEPGYTDVKLLKVENEGNLALKWKATIVSASPLSDLANVIDVYVLPYGVLTDNSSVVYPTTRDLTGYTNVGTVADFVETIETTTVGTLKAGEAAYLGIALKMQEDANNTYQNMDLGAFDIQILATQLNYEEDSIDENYDENALFAVAEDLYKDETTGTLVATSTAGLSSAAAVASEDDTIQSITYKTAQGDKTVPVARDTATLTSNLFASSAETVVLAAGKYTFPNTALSEGDVIVCDENTVFEGVSGMSIDGATIVGATFDSEGNTNDNTGAGTGTINGTFTNCTFTGNHALRYCYAYAGDTIVFENCVFDGDLRGIHFDAGDGKVYFKNCTIYGFNAFGGTLEEAVFEGCTFGNGRTGYNGLNLYCDTTIINCHFEFNSGKTNFVDMEGTGKTLTITNCTATLDGATANVSAFVGGSKLAQNTVVYN